MNNRLVLNKDLSILVVSCDKYSDLWPVFFSLKKKYWSGCRFKTFLGTNTYTYDEQDVESIKIGEDRSWAENVKMMLESIPTKYVLIMLEDFLFDKKINNKYIEELLAYADSNEIDCLRLEPKPGPVKIHNKRLHIGFVNPKAPYYVSTQPAIWNKTALVDLLKDGYSAWDFEQKNSEYLKNEGSKYKFMSTSRYALHHQNGVERGKWYRSVVRFLRREGIDLHFDERGIIDDLSIRKKMKLFNYNVKMKIKAILAEFI